MSTESNVARCNVAFCRHESTGCCTHDFRVAVEEVSLHGPYRRGGCCNGCMFNAPVVGSIPTGVSRINDFFF